MTDSRAAIGSDRLPWLNEEPASPPAPRRTWRFPWGPAIAGFLVVATGSYWIGQRSVSLAEPEANAPTAPPPAPAGETQTAPHAEVQASPPTRVRQASQPEVPSSTPSPVKERTRAPPATPQSSPTAPVSPAQSSRQLWSAWDSGGAHGRMIRVGAFSSISGAKLGWRRMADAKPTLAHLPATVVGVHDSRGIHYYRLQIGTSSQAHSEVLCQRVQKIQFSCAVVGLPLKPKGVER